MTTHVAWPAWRYGPGGAAEVFHHEDDVPKGWHDHPSKIISAETTGSKPLPVKTEKLPGEQTGTKPIKVGSTIIGAQTGSQQAEGVAEDVSNDLDANGWPWTAELHAATQGKTKDGLWRMKVGKAKPDPKPGFPKPVLDL